LKQAEGSLLPAKPMLFPTVFPVKFNGKMIENFRLTGGLP
jgi:hypothetical protein